MTDKKVLPKAIICDLDGTLCNISHRRHYVQSKPKNWKAFHQGLTEDVLYDFCAELLEMYKSKGYAILLMTGRPEDYKKDTEKWLIQHQIKYDMLLMRKRGDGRLDYIIKKELYQEFIKYKYNVNFVLEDRDQVVRMWREEGLTCLQVAEGNF